MTQAKETGSEVELTDADSLPVPPGGGREPVLVGNLVRRRRWVVIAVIAVVVTAALGAWWFTARETDLTPSEEAVELSTDTIRVRDLVEFETFDGTLSYEDPLSVVALSNGIVVTVPEEGAILERGDLLFIVADDISDSQVTAAQQRVAAARAQVAAAEVQRSNVVSGAGDAELASAQAAVAQAQLALDQLTEAATEAEVASARAALTQASEAYRDLFDGPDEAAVNSAEAAVDQAKARIDGDEAALDLAEAQLEAAQADYCALDPLPAGDLCDSNDIPLSDSDVDDLIDAIGDANEAGDAATAAVLQSFVNANSAFENAEAALEVSEASLETAELALEDLLEGPTQAQIDLALANVLTAEERLQNVVDGPDPLAIEQAGANLAAAEARLADLRAGATSSERNQASFNLENARLGLQAAVSDLADLIGEPDTALILYGGTQAYRSLSVDSAPGPDIRQLELNLVALGFTAEGALVVDDVFDGTTATAVASWQESLGLEPTGEVELGWAFFVPGPGQVRASVAEVGDTVVTNTPLYELQPIETVTMTLTSSGVRDEVRTTQRVNIELPIEDRDLVDVGTVVEIELPDDVVVGGEVLSVGAVPVIVSAVGQESERSYVEVVVALSEPVDPIWTGVTVEVDVASQIAEDVLAVPVSALLALQEGGYAVEVPQADGSTRLVGVDTGMFADGFVEISGDGLEEGIEVVVP